MEGNCRNLLLFGHDSDIPSYEALIQGQDDYVVEFDNKYYSFATLEHLKTFMRCESSIQNYS